MMIKRVHLTLLMLIVLAISACQASHKVEATPSVTSSPDKQNLLYGHYIWGHEENSFQACGDQNVYWVVSSDEQMKNIAKQYEKTTNKPYEEVYFQFKGHFLGKATDGFATQYDGQIFVEKLIEMKKKTSQDCTNTK